MGWATQHIARLKQGETVTFRPRGNSMLPMIRSGQLVTVSPLGEQKLLVGDVVLCRVGGQEYLHLVKAVQPGMVQIGNNRGKVNGWTSLNQVFGILVKVGD